MREVRRALIEADVALPKSSGLHRQGAQPKAVGAEVVKSVTPGQMVVKIVHDQLVEMLGEEASADRSQRAGAGRDHDGRPAGLG
jgi:signal recognition particle subunit SRP54